MTEQIIRTAGAVAVIAAAFLTGRCTAPARDADRTPPGIIRDTIRDTMVVEKPVMTTEWVYGTIEIPSDSLVFVNTGGVEVPTLPRQTREYRTGDYCARVSGYDPVLESLEIYREREVIRDGRLNTVRIRGDFSYSGTWRAAVRAEYARQAGFMEAGAYAGYDFVGKRPEIGIFAAIPMKF